MPKFIGFNIAIIFPSLPQYQLFDYFQITIWVFVMFNIFL